MSGTKQTSPRRKAGLFIAAGNTPSSYSAAMTLDTQMTLALLQELLLALRANDAEGFKGWLALGLEELGRPEAGNRPKHFLPGAVPLCDECLRRRREVQRDLYKGCQRRREGPGRNLPRSQYRHEHLQLHRSSVHPRAKYQGVAGLERHQQLIRGCE